MLNAETVTGTLMTASPKRGTLPPASPTPLAQNGGQGQNRTADTRILSPPKSAPRSTQEHPKQPISAKCSLGRCSWVTVGDAGWVPKWKPDCHGLRHKETPSVLFSTCYEQ